MPNKNIKSSTNKTQAPSQGKSAPMATPAPKSNQSPANKGKSSK